MGWGGSEGLQGGEDQGTGAPRLWWVLGDRGMRAAASSGEGLEPTHSAGS